MDIAIDLFAKRGIAETTLAAIAREAGVTPAMVHYYFKTREQLLDILIDERFSKPRKAIDGIFSANANDPVKAITDLAQRLVEVAIEYPWYPSLWMREIIGESGLLWRRMHERFGDAHRRAVYECIARWQKEGKINANLQPSLIFLSLLGLTVLPLAAAKKWRDDPFRSRLSPTDIATHAVALLQQGVTPAMAAPKKRRLTAR